ncbi:transglutaminase-like cysteine peptidase [Pelagibacterium xiamenense]|uniref:transglutaminase-like cysteine peptidase n=1 Tax=Pelagibacterium xiamenense TaxID=2901140 RepID=UPI001E40D3C8|nr:transglutaminase-like cysteine peptidase [Pelagibacterium xiamenense]MCD7058909.1 transglutaminase-like cysteine peptidase [Pelagibacterium xiamenense]
MRITPRVGSAILALSILLVTPSAHAIAPWPGQESFGPLGRISTAGSFATPLGFQVFCLRAPARCQPTPEATPELTPDLFALLDQVNREVNAAIRPQLRASQIWELGAEAGDCKDYAMNKWNRLIEMGVPAGALHLAIGYTEDGVGHAVVLVRTAQGDLVLDNLADEVLAWNEVTHDLVAMATSNPLRWTAAS